MYCDVECRYNIAYRRFNLCLQCPPGQFVHSRRNFAFELSVDDGYEQDM